ncbi:MAG: DUF1294 domain-containing protein [Clostridia bacterium]|nr:DUF1294 domain-containing protein [Clostridia bacterium]
MNVLLALQFNIWTNLHILLIAMTALCVAVFGIIGCALTIKDKKLATGHHHRISEKSLMWLGVLGGALPMWITMRLVHHKTRYKKFMVGLPLLAILHVALFFLLWQIVKPPFDVAKHFPIYINLIFVILLAGGFGLIGAILLLKDRVKAQRHQRRIPEDWLMLCGVLGGALLMWPTMILIQHKTRRKRFAIGFPIIALLHIALFMFLWKNRELVVFRW